MPGYPQHVTHVTLEGGAVVHDFHCPATQHVGRAHNHRIADTFGHGFGLFRAAGNAIFRLAEAQLVQHGLEALAVFRPVNGVCRSAQQGNARCLKRAGELERCLPTILHNAALDRAFALLATDEGNNILCR